MKLDNAQIVRTDMAMSSQGTGASAEIEITGHISGLGLMLLAMQQEGIIARDRAKLKLFEEAFKGRKVLNIGLETNMGDVLSDNNLVTELRKKDINIWGVDPQVRVGHFGAMQGYFKQGIAQDLPFKDKEFDDIVSIYLFDEDYFPQPIEYQQAAREMNRVLKIGGRLFLDSIGPNKVLLEELRQAGFDIDEIKGKYRVYFLATKRQDVDTLIQQEFLSPHALYGEHRMRGTEDLNGNIQHNQTDTAMISRRDFIRFLGAGAVVAASTGRINEGRINYSKEYIISIIINSIKAYQKESGDIRLQAEQVYEALLSLWGEQELNRISIDSLNRIINNFVIKGKDRMYRLISSMKDLLGKRVLIYISYSPRILEDRVVVTPSGMRLVNGVSEEDVDELKKLMNRSPFLFDVPSILRRERTVDIKETIKHATKLQNLARGNKELFNLELVSLLKEVALAVLALYPHSVSMNEDTYNGILLAILFDMVLVQGDNAHGLNIGIETIINNSPMILLSVLAHELGHYVNIPDFFLKETNREQSIVRQMKGVYTYATGIEELMADLGLFAWWETYGDWHVEGDKVKKVADVVRETQEDLGYLRFTYTRFPLEMHYVPRIQLQWLMDQMKQKKLKPIQWKDFYQEAQSVYKELKQDKIENLAVFITRLLARYLFVKREITEVQFVRMLNMNISTSIQDMLAPNEIARLLSVMDQAMSVKDERVKVIMPDENNKGGIDLNSIDAQLKVDRENRLRLEGSIMENIYIESLTPIIKGIEPLKSLESFLAPA